VKVAVEISGQPRVSTLTTAFARSFVNCDSVDWYVHFWSENTPNKKIQSQWLLPQDQAWVRGKFEQNLPPGHRLIAYAHSAAPTVDATNISAYHCNASDVLVMWQGWLRANDLRLASSETYDFVVKGRVDAPIKGRIDFQTMAKDAISITTGVWDPDCFEEPRDRRVKQRFADSVFVGPPALMNEAVRVGERLEIVKDLKEFHPDLSMIHYLNCLNIPVVRNYWDTGLHYPAPWGDWIDR